jgi:hypothetical protein
MPVPALVQLFLSEPSRPFSEEVDVAAPRGHPLLARELEDPLLSYFQVVP